MSQFNWKKIDYTTPASAQGGPGIQGAITWYLGSPLINMTAAQFAAQSQASGLTLGATWWLGGGPEASGGNAFMIVKNSSAGALALGQVVAWDAPAASTVGAAAPAPSSSAINWVAGGLTVNAEKNNYLWVTATGATLPQLRRIKSNTATAITVAGTDYLRPNSPTDQDVFDTVPTAGDVADIIRPYQVKVCTGSLCPAGIALGAVTASNYTVIQVAGLACVLSKGDVTPTVPMVPAVPGAAGVISGSVAAAANLYTGAGVILPLIASAAASLIIPCYVNFTGN